MLWAELHRFHISCDQTSFSLCYSLRRPWAASCPVGVLGVGRGFGFPCCFILPSPCAVSLIRAS